MSIRSELHTMQAAIALSPNNKAFTTLDNGDIFAIQEYAHERYRMWAIAPGDVPIWAGTLTEREIDEFPTKYKVDPSKKVWLSMGIVPDLKKDYEAIETTIQVLTGQIINLRTELLVIKSLLAEREPEE